MTVPTHTRITFSGVFGSTVSPVEIWSFNVHTGPLSATTAANAATVATAARTAWQTNWGPLLSTDITLTRTRVAVVDSNSRVAKDFDGSFKQGDNVTAGGGSVAMPAASRMPTQAALVISLRSARADATGKGRFFLPFQMPNYALQTDFRLTSATADAVAAAAKAFLNGVASAASAPIVVASGGGKAGGGTGYLSPVTSVRVGRVVDTMRSRRNAQLEAYSVLAL